MRKGFTLMEIIIAVALITTALIACISLISFSISSVKISKSRIIAVGLAQEGLEIVRNIRDNNWLSDKGEPGNWRDGLGSGDWRVQYNINNLISYSETPLKINSNRIYQYDSGNPTFFYRRINIEQISNNRIRVICEITWQEMRKNQNVKAETIFYNWLEES